MNSELQVILEPGIAQKLQFAINRNGGILADVEWLSTGENFKNISLLVRGEAELVIKPKPTLAPEVVLDPIMRVDRARPSYPDWMKNAMHPELESAGPAEYDISAVEQWLHDGQKGGKYIKGNKIYNHLTKTDTLKTCLGLRDLEEIQKKGIAFFLKHFKGKAVFGWAGIVRDRHDRLFVPYLCEGGDGVVLDWYWTDYGWYGPYPALRFASSPQDSVAKVS